MVIGSKGNPAAILVDSADAVVHENVEGNAVGSGFNPLGSSHAILSGKKT